MRISQQRAVFATVQTTHQNFFLEFEGGVSAEIDLAECTFRDDTTQENRIPTEEILSLNEPKMVVTVTGELGYDGIGCLRFTKATLIVVDKK